MLLRNDGTLPLAAPATHRRDRPERRRPLRHARLLLVPVARRRAASGRRAWASSIPTLLEALRAEFPAQRDPLRARHRRRRRRDRGHRGCRGARGIRRRRVLALGDRAGLFGRGTSGEGCDAESLDLPGAQQAAPRRRARDGHAHRAHAARRPPVRARPRRDGVGRDRAGVLRGRGGRRGDRRRAQRPREPERPPARERAGDRRARSRRPTSRRRSPGRPTCRTSTRRPPSRSATGSATPGSSGSRSTATTPRSASTARRTVRLRLRNTGDRSGTEVVQLYLHDPVASVVRPVQRLIGFARVDLEPGQGAEVRFTVPADLASFTSRSGARIVEPGELVLGAGPLERRPAVRARGAAHGRDARRRPHPPAAPRGRGRGRARGIRDPRRRRVTDPARRRRRPGASPTRPAAAPCCRAPRGSWPGPCAASSRRGSSARRIASRAASSPMRRSGWCTVVSRGLTQRASGMSS